MTDFRIILKNKNQSGSVPPAASLLIGELALNPADGGLYYLHTTGTLSGSVQLPRARSSVSSSYAATASLLLGSVVSASYALTASYAVNGGSGGGSGLFASSSLSSSWASSSLSSSYAATASLLLGSVVSASYALTSSYAANGGTTTVISAIREIANTTTSGSQTTVIFDSIPSIYRDLILRISGRATNASTTVGLRLRFNSDSGSNYSWRYWNIFGSGQAVSDTYLNAGEFAGASSPSNFLSLVELAINGYTSSFRKTVKSEVAFRFGNSATETLPEVGAGTWDNTNSISTIEISLSAGEFVSGTTVTLYGMGGVGGSFIPSASFATSASWASSSLSSSYASTASLLLGSVVSSSYALTASYALNGGSGASVSSSYPFAVTGTTIYSNDLTKAGLPTTSAFAVGLFAGSDTRNSNYSIFIGEWAGRSASDAYDSIMLGNSAGRQSSASWQNVMIGDYAGFNTSHSNDVIFVGADAGNLSFRNPYSIALGNRALYQTSQSDYAVVLGSSAAESASNSDSMVAIGRFTGYLSTSSSNATFLGRSAGNLTTRSPNIIAIGRFAGYSGSYNSQSIYIGTYAGYVDTGTGPGRNNIVIGSNISLPTGFNDTTNIAGILYTSGNYSDLDSFTQLLPVSTGRVGILTHTPSYSLDVSGSGRFASTLLLSGSVYISGAVNSNNPSKFLVIDSSTGQLFTTSSVGGGSSISSSYALTASYAANGGGSSTPTFPYSGSAIISGSLIVTGAVLSSGTYEAVGGPFYFRGTPGTNATLEIRGASATGTFRTTSDVIIGAVTNTNLVFAQNNTTAWYIDANKYFLPNVNNTYDIGATAQRVRTVWTQAISSSQPIASSSYALISVSGSWASRSLSSSYADRAGSSSVATLSTSAYTSSYLEGAADGPMSGTFSGSGAQIFNLNWNNFSNRPVGLISSSLQAVSWSVATASYALNGGSGGGGNYTAYRANIGYDVIGVGIETMTQRRVYLKAVSSSYDGVILGVSAYVNNNASDNVQDYSAVIMSDNAGNPHRVLAYNRNTLQSILLESASSTPVARWLNVPVSLNISSGTVYWIGIQNNTATGQGSIAYDTGSDKYYTSAGDWFTDGGFYTITTTARNYSIVANQIFAGTGSIGGTSISSSWASSSLSSSYAATASYALNAGASLQGVYISQSYQFFDRDRYPTSLTASTFDRNFTYPVSQTFDIIGTSSAGTNLYFPQTGSAIFGTTTTSNSRWMNNLPTQSLDSWVAVFKLAANFNEYSDGIISGNPALGVVISSGTAGATSNVNNSEAIALGYINSNFKVETWRMTGGFNYSSTPYTDNVMGDRKWFTDWIYVRIKKSGPNISYALGYNGETYETFASHAVSTHTGTPTMLGVWRSSIGTKPEFMNVAWMRFATGSETVINGDYVTIPNSFTASFATTSSYAQNLGLNKLLNSPNNIDILTGSYNDDFNSSSYDATRYVWRNQGTALATVNRSNLVMYGTATAGDQLRILEFNPPSGNIWTIETYVTNGASLLNYNWCGLGLVDTGSGQIEANTITFNTATATGYMGEVIRYNTVSSYNSSPAQPTTFGPSAYLRIERNTNSVTHSFSATGLENTFIVKSMHSVTAFLTNDIHKIAFVFNGNAASGLACSTFDYIKQIR